MKGKSKVSGYLLAVFLGFIGAHSFYYGRVWRGVLYFALNFIVTPIIPMLLGWIDTIYLHKWHEQETSGVPAKKKVTAPQTQPQVQAQKPVVPTQKPETSPIIEQEANIEEPKEVKPEPVVAEEVTLPQPTEQLDPPANPEKKKGTFSSIFNPEKNVILDKYAHIKTPQSILIEVKNLETKPKPKKNEVYYLNREDLFFIDSMKYRYKLGSKTREIPLKAYYTTFSDLSKVQKDWYFYWRNEVIQGRYPDVDLSYVMLFSYELINYSYNKKAAFNISMMEILHEAYHGRIRQLDYYLGEWIGDMLLEVGEDELASKWVQSSRSHRNIKLYEELQNPDKPINKISITTWKSMVSNHRETPFYQEHKKQVHKVFKEGAALHAEFIEREGENLIDYWFVSNSYRDVKSTFNAAVVVRKAYDVHVYVDEVEPTDECRAEITALYKTSENIVRELNGEKRKLKVNENDLPEGLKEKLEECFGLRTPETEEVEEPVFIDAKPEKNESRDHEGIDSERFTTVQDSDGEVYGEPIPPQPEEEPKKSKTIAFDMDKIRKLQSEQEKMILNVNGKLNQPPTDAPPATEQPVEVASTQEAVEEKVVNLDPPAPDEVTEAPTPAQSKTNTTVISLFDDDEEVDAEAFIESLTQDEIAFINTFKEGQLSEEIAATFAKQQGFMLGMVVTDLNEKAEEHLGDNLLETQDEFLIIHEEFEDVMNDIRAKGVG
ncbi:hypothetical protein DH09_01405 [Bacillaceae bacterium JMAK1]|nr:hypothetical protein DH09_01405 [Bacillaceae bacterium JMAK1]